MQGTTWGGAELLLSTRRVNLAHSNIGTTRERGVIAAPEADPIADFGWRGHVGCGKHRGIRCARIAGRRLVG